MISLTSNIVGARYTDEAKAKVLTVLDSNAGNVLKTARDCNLNESTIRRFVESSHKQSRLREMRDENRDDLADLFEEVSRRYLDRALDESAILDTKGKDAVTAAAIAVDKMRLLREQSTAITEQRSPQETEFINTVQQMIQVRADASKHLTINQIIIQVREELTSKGLGSLLRLLPDVTEE